MRKKKGGCEHLGHKSTSKYGSDLAIHSKQTIQSRKKGRKDQELSEQKRNNIQTGDWPAQWLKLLWDHPGKWVVPWVTNPVIYQARYIPLQECSVVTPWLLHFRGYPAFPSLTGATNRVLCKFGCDCREWKKWPRPALPTSHDTSGLKSYYVLIAPAPSWPSHRLTPRE